MPNTGGWQIWQTVKKTGLSLSAGAHVIRLAFDTGTAENGGVGNYNWLRLTVASPSSTPYGGTPAALPGTVQAENFDEGASGVAYFDTTAGNTGGKYRTTDVDIESTTDVGGGYNVGRTRPGEWLKYSVTVASAGTYALDVRVANIGYGRTVPHRDRRHRPHRADERAQHGRLAGLADGEEDGAVAFSGRARCSAGVRHGHGGERRGGELQLAPLHRRKPQLHAVRRHPRRASRNGAGGEL